MSKTEKGILYAIRKAKRKEMSKQLKTIYEFVDTYFFIEGLSDSDYKKLRKKLNKCRKRLEEGKHLKKCLSEDNVQELVLLSNEFVEEYMKSNYEDYL